MTTTGAPLGRREFLVSSMAAVAACYAPSFSAEKEASKQRVIVGAHPWVYAATQPKYDITPVLP